jgi:putative transposon-encoded protein
MKKQHFEVDGYEILTKLAMPAGTSGRVFVPKRWIGKSVTLIVNEEPEQVTK